MDPKQVQLVICSHGQTGSDLVAYITSGTAEDITKATSYLSTLANHGPT